MLFVAFFVFKQKKAYEMRMSDWSSDACSSDLKIARCRPPMVSLLSSLFDNVMARARFLGAERAAQSATGRPPWRHRPAPARAAGSEDSVRSRPSGRKSPWRAEGRRVGNECVSTGIYRWSPCNSKKKNDEVRHTS